MRRQGVAVVAAEEQRREGREGCKVVDDRLDAWGLHLGLSEQRDFGRIHSAIEQQLFEDQGT